MRFPVLPFLRQALLHFSFLVSLFSLLLPFPAQAQQPPPRDPAQEQMLARYQLAESYLRVGQYDRAIGLLEDLHNADPSSITFYDRLKEAYVAVKRYNDALRLVETRLTQMPSPSVMSEKAALLYQMERMDEAKATWDAAVQLAPTSPSSYRAVYHALLSNRLFDDAIALLLKGREATRQPDAFRADLGYLYGVVGRHEEAMQEYLTLLRDDGNQLPFIQSRISRLSEQENAIETAIASVEQAVRQEPLNRALRQLSAWLYLEKGMYDKALDANRAIDRLEQENGQVLYGFAQTAAAAGAYGVAAEAYEEILDRYPDTPVAPSARYGMARLRELEAEALGETAFDARGNRIQAPNYEKAVAAYQRFLQDFPAHTLAADALIQLGLLQKEIFFDLGAAEAVLSEAVADFPNSNAAAEARYHLGEIALIRDDLPGARIIFGRLEDDLRTGELAERARLELALIDFYSGQFESALTRVRAMNENTATDVANDAIELKILLIENKGPDSLNTPLQMYAHAERLKRQRRLDQVLQTLDEIQQQYPQHRLADEIVFLRAETLRQQGQAEAARDAFRAIGTQFPTSYLADRSLFNIAELYAGPLRDKEQAITAYEDLLVQYPGSLLAAEARARIRKLRQEGV